MISNRVQPDRINDKESKTEGVIMEWSDVNIDTGDQETARASGTITKEVEGPGAPDGAMKMAEGIKKPRRLQKNTERSCMDCLKNGDKDDETAQMSWQAHQGDTDCEGGRREKIGITESSESRDTSAGCSSLENVKDTGWEHPTHPSAEDKSKDSNDEGDLESQHRNKRWKPDTNMTLEGHFQDCGGVYPCGGCPLETNRSFHPDEGCETLTEKKDNSNLWFPRGSFVELTLGDGQSLNSHRVSGSLISAFPLSPVSPTTVALAANLVPPVTISCAFGSNTVVTTTATMAKDIVSSGTSTILAVSVATSAGHNLDGASVNQPVPLSEQAATEVASKRLPANSTKLRAGEHIRELSKNCTGQKPEGSQGVNISGSVLERSGTNSGSRSGTETLICSDKCDRSDVSEVDGGMMNIRECKSDTERGRQSKVERKQPDTGLETACDLKCSVIPHREQHFASIDKSQCDHGSNESLNSCRCPSDLDSDYSSGGSCTTADCDNLSVKEICDDDDDDVPKIDKVRVCGKDSANDGYNSMSENSDEEPCKVVGTEGNFECERHGKEHGKRRRSSVLADISESLCSMANGRARRRRRRRSNLPSSVQSAVGAEEDKGVSSGHEEEFIPHGSEQLQVNQKDEDGIEDGHGEGTCFRQTSRLGRLRRCLSTTSLLLQHLKPAISRAGQQQPPRTHLPSHSIIKPVPSQVFLPGTVAFIARHCCRDYSLPSPGAYTNVDVMDSKSPPKGKDAVGATAASSRAESYSLYENEAGSDIILLVGEGSQRERVPAHSWVLAADNEYFRALFQGPMANPDKKVHTIHEDAKGFQNLLKWLYRRECPFQSTDSALLTLQVAIPYLCPELAALCAEYISHNLKCSNVLKVLQSIWRYCLPAAHRQSLALNDSIAPSAPSLDTIENTSLSEADYITDPDVDVSQHTIHNSLQLLKCDNMDPTACCNPLLNQCFEFLDAHAEEVLSSEALEELDHDTLLLICRRDNLNIPSEMSVFNAVVRWSTAECKRQFQKLTDDNRRALLQDILYNVRFLAMTQEQLVTDHQGSGLLSHEEFNYLAARLRGRSPNTVPQTLVPYLETMARKRQHIPQGTQSTPPSNKKSKKKDKNNNGKKKYTKNDLILDVVTCLAAFFD
ncbi:uncharacterized protein LOC143018938 [Oratosquilla oratoria]|uniref:uncharacterized protein LOC143018938 n=1 Tax=Oratosquilla oratoria TaxID=337810 RepID=UPI003F7619BC